MSTNCIRCVKNKRTGPDLLCDECRAESRTEWKMSESPPGAPRNVEPPRHASELYQVEHTSREVIENKLLTALEDGGVAVICSKQDLEDLVFACNLWLMRDGRATRLGNLRRGMEQLLREAFPLNEKGQP